MKENEIQIRDAKSQKARIRERYKGVDLDELDVIPAIPQENFYENTNEKRVAVYARVSTDDPRQTSSYELQKNHYKDVVSRHPHAQARELDAFDSKSIWNVSEEGQPFCDTPGLNITSTEVVGIKIEQMTCNMEQETTGNGE